MRTQAAIFDIDGTLLPMSLERMLIVCMLKHKLVSFGTLTKRFFGVALRFGGKRAILTNKFYLEGIKVQEIENLLDGGCWEEIKGRFFPSMLDMMRLFADADVPIVLLSGTIDILARRVSQYLGIQQVISSQLEVKDGAFTGRLTGIYPYRDGKVRLAMKLLEDNGWNPSDVWAFGDSMSDFGLLSMVGHPVAVNPSRKLSRMAQKLNWPVLIAGKRHWSPFSE